MRWTATAQLAVAAGLLAPVTASAQLEIAPQIGLYVPSGSLIKQGSPSNPSTQLEKRPEGSILLGVRALFWATKRLGVVAGVSFSPSLVAVTDSVGTTDQTGGVLLAHSQLLVVLTSDRAPWFAHVGLGAGVVRRSGAPWQYASGATLLLGGCASGKTTTFEAASAAVPASHFKTIGTLATSVRGTDLRMMVQVRQQLQKAGVNAVPVKGRFSTVADAVLQLCASGAEQPLDGILTVAYNDLVLYDCETHKAAYEIHSGSLGLPQMTNRLIEYLTAK